MSDWISREDALKTLSALVDAAIEGRLTDRTEGLRDAKDIIRALPAVQPDANLLEAACVAAHNAYEAAAHEAGWTTNTQSRKPWAEVPEANKVAMRAGIGAALALIDIPAVQPVMVRLVFNNADATPKTTVLDVSAEAVPDIMAWYGAYCSGDRYTVTMDGRNVPMNQNGEPTKGERDD